MYECRVGYKLSIKFVCYSTVICIIIRSVCCLDLTKLTWLELVVKYVCNTYFSIYINVYIYLIQLKMLSYHISYLFPINNCWVGIEYQY